MNGIEERHFLPRRLRDQQWLAAFCIAGSLLAVGTRAELWCTAYYPGWEASSMPASQIDFEIVSHVIHFALVPNPDGSLDSEANVITAENSADVVSRAHAAGKKALICVGGADSQSGFQSSTTDDVLPTFISNLTHFMVAGGYDGVDVDWEPLEAADTAQYSKLINSLRSSLNAITPRPLLTAAIASPPTPPALIAALQDQFDQINLMTYDLSGPYPGWVTWFNAPIFNDWYAFPSTGELVPAAEEIINSVRDAGVVLSKVGMGIAFYGLSWSGGAGTSTEGVSEPRQSWMIPPATTQISYADIIDTYPEPDLYRWDAAAGAAYLTIDKPGSANDRFNSYDDPRTCQSKVSFARNRGLGGVMIWELAQDQYAERGVSLLQAIKRGFATPGALGIEVNGQNISFSFATIPLGSYAVQWTGNLKTGAWNTLLLTNISGTGGVLRLTDKNAFGDSVRFYRVRTPP